MLRSGCANDRLITGRRGLIRRRILWRGFKRDLIRISFILPVRGKMSSVASVCNGKMNYFGGVQAPAAGYVYSFTTARTLHGKRIGERTLAHVEEMCREHGKQFLRLDCGSHVAGLRRYYEAYGFQRVGETTVMNDQFTLYQKPLDQPSQI